jgi:polysaccharide transporter, PST family
MRHAYFNDAGAAADLAGKSLRGGITTMLAQGVNVVVQVVSTIVLARMLLPEDFGLVAMVSAVTGFASIFIDLGTRDAFTQRGKVTEGEASALFWITFGVAFVFAAIVSLSGKPLAHFYDEARLPSIALAMSLTFILPGLYFQQQALMRRALMFQKLALIDVGANLLSTAISIMLAYFGYGYWALVWKFVLTSTFTGLAVWATCGWWPGRPEFTPGVKSMLRFGLNVTGFTLTDYVARSADRVALGYTVGPRELGYYQNSFTVYDNFINVCSLHNVATATLSKLREDTAALTRAWSTALSSLAFFAAPALAVLAVVGQDLVVVLLGKKWLAAGTILTVLALRGPAHVIERTLGWLHVVSGNPDRWRHWGLLNCAVMVAALFAGLPFGAIGVASAYTAVTYLLFIPAVAYSGRPLGIRTGDVIRAVGPQIVSALATAAVGLLFRFFVLQNMTPFSRLIVLCAICATFYLLVVTLVFRVTKPLSLVLSLVRRRTGAGDPGRA